MSKLHKGQPYAIHAPTSDATGFDVFITNQVRYGMHLIRKENPDLEAVRIEIRPIERATIDGMVWEMKETRTQ